MLKLMLFVRSLVFFLGMLIITPIFATLAILLFPIKTSRARALPVVAGRVARYFG